ncbi:MAG TPA: hypothetical protein VFN68_10665 [Acidimicrobiales bacterium]|nr:hypothetical protein [Acidimicrobiales bacterium]
MAPGTFAEVLARAEARARVDPQFAGLLDRLVGLPTVPAGELERPAAADISRRRHREAVEEFRAAALATSAVQEMLGLRTPQAVHRMRSRGRLIGMPIGNHTWFPAWQFSGGTVRPDLGRVLELLGRFTSDPVAADRIMRVVRDDLGGVSIATALDRPDGSARAWNALAELPA